MKSRFYDVVYVATSFISFRRHEVTRGVHCVTAPCAAIGPDAVPKRFFRHYGQVGMTVIIVLTGLHFE